MVSEKEYYSLKEVMEIRTAHQKEVDELRWKLNEIAINKAETAMTERMEASNNKFALLKEQAAVLPSKNDLEGLRSEFRTFKEGIEKAIDELKSKSDKGEGKSVGYAQFIGWILAAIAVIGFIIDKIK